jgi:hypothetical protein
LGQEDISAMLNNEQLLKKVPMAVYSPLDD